MDINDALLHKLSQLSMLELPEEKLALKENLEEILGFMDNLNALDLENIEAFEQGATPLREDIIEHDEHIPQAVLKHAPQTQEGYFIVPKIIET